MKLVTLNPIPTVVAALLLATTLVQCQVHTHRRPTHRAVLVSQTVGTGGDDSAGTANDCDSRCYIIKTSGGRVNG
jgi:hypothetical protein